ncbi:MAG: hypothetical protein MJ192_07530 [Clostridia bacterium]|nr:hypothetical protein [Clostridia bacterium]
MKEKLLIASFFAGWTALFTAVTTALSGQLIRGLGPILTRAGEQQFGAIFSQIRTARLLFPLWLPILIWLGYTVLLYFTRRTEKRHALKMTGVVALGVVLLLLVTAGTVWLTKVNGIRVSDVVLSLLKYVENGITDKM